MYVFVGKLLCILYTIWKWKKNAQRRWLMHQQSSTPIFNYQRHFTLMTVSSLWMRSLLSFFRLFPLVPFQPWKYTNATNCQWSTSDLDGNIFSHYNMYTMSILRCKWANFSISPWWFDTFFLMKSINNSKRKLFW